MQSHLLTKFSKDDTFRNLLFAILGNKTLPRKVYSYSKEYVPRGQILSLTLLHSERPKLYSDLVVPSA